MLGGASLLEAARYYIRRHPTKLPRKPVQEVVEEFIGSRRKAKRSEDYVEALETGHTVKVLFTNYREPVTPDEAKSWFEIVPKVGR